jgi:hypothetical protein
MGDEGDDPASFPIPRVRAIANPRPALQPEYENDSPQFNFELFQLFFSLVIYDLPAYELGNSTDITPALVTVGKALEPDGPSTIMLEHLVRKFLLSSQSHLLQLTSNPVLAKIAQLHHELYLASEILRPKKTQAELCQYADMLTGEVYDLFNSEFARKVNTEFWDAGKTAELVINELLTKEIERIRLLNPHSGNVLSLCAVQRALDKAPGPASQQITSWAKDNALIVEK